MEIINTKNIIEKELPILKNKYNALKKKYKKEANFKMIVVGNDLATKSYIKSKEKMADEIGILNDVISLDENIRKEELEKIIKDLNEDTNVSAILLQMPLPNHLEYKELIDLIDPIKDVDSLCSTNMGKLVLDKANYIPCTAKAIIKILDEINEDVEKKDICIVGRSNIVGKPLANLLINKRATVQVCNSKTKDLASKVKNSDIVISATGVASLIKKEYIKEGSILLDVGISRVDGKLKGDFDFDNIIKEGNAKYITKVPGGVGPITVLSLMENIILAFERGNVEK
ncbi:bifunctional 5,10-methylenetetrahydrofolate dehydrogenase/5,10-methenyltetrahydrofolate cyclohydrolase [Oceanivirga miroungae]|uniref:Bifunctional protein FolD n=1 Tax=Oceanivirga miroungae TaxID=1130046 RepID=A0A6I8M6G2_9FUSO|nr:bifunctional 5,10-methylenetetrahydrofolate dehydrogenase/5,10-methenyltetrahydrofolate cyclohydrolase [Oceanivirga miroungae]VWL85480.1 methenyltetrahydrofolate cyclohydrolase [Oceanivirga miroungae]